MPTRRRGFDLTDRPRNPFPTVPLEMMEGNKRVGVVGKNSGGSVVTVDMVSGSAPATYSIFNSRGGDPTEPEALTLFVGKELIAFQDSGGDGREPSTDLALIVEWSCQNFTGRAEIDVLNGTTLSLMASELKVSLRSTAENPDYSSGSYRVSVGAAPGIRPANAPPQRTVRLPPHTVGGSIFGPDSEFELAVPTFARGFYPLSAGDGDGRHCDFTVFQKSRNAVLCQHLYVINSPAAPHLMSPLRIPLVNHARSIVVKNIDLANNIIDFCLVFDLSL
jgi:hypothetical protein